MKHSAILVFVGLCCVCYGGAVPQKYTTKYDNVDIDSIIRNERLLRNYMDCIMDRGRCTKEGAELKKNIPDALQNNCSKCSEFQKNGTRKIITYIAKNKKDWFLEVEAKYDPTHIFRKTYQDEIDRSGIKIIEFFYVLY
uniref:Putative chemosensory protein 6 n=2 Tax=Anthonomus grandis TaxID=7044 RepID=A0A2P9JZD7_ANTGR|nr:putative chemosensory protein 6 [Anthonomus grandis]